ncbi:unnamed protein product [Vicia faba]|uniref:RING-type domain-containing protein n=1 Tax=Vicia faba TaxID=3906 RepID=A0AAV0ZE26_VICFA|nr:unnamed protein product [Vicia faba]
MEDSNEAPSSCYNHEDSNEDIQNKHMNQQEQINISNTKRFMILMWDNVWSCIVVLVLFWLIESITLTVGVRGSNLQLGPYSSHLIQINSMLVQSIKVEQNNKPKPGMMLYGFDFVPSLDVKINWTEMYDVSISPKSQKEWIFYLNKDSQLDVLYSAKSPVAPLILVIAKGRESIAEWKEDPLSPDATLYWNNIYGSGNVTQKISDSSTYYVAIANMNHQNVKVQLKFNVNALLYNTTNSYKRCSLDNSSCRMNTALSANMALLTTACPREGVTNQEWFDVHVSYEPRWIIYLIGTGVMAVIIICALEFYKMLQTNEENARFQFQQVEVISERAPLLSRKDSDVTSRSSSYDSFSSDEENSSEGKSIIEGETSNNDIRCLCVICFDARRDCFFLPCGHFATCYACGTRIAAESCTCPICRRKMKKLRKIYIV